MPREKASSEKKSLLLDFFYTCPPEPKSKAEAKDRPEPKSWLTNEWTGFATLTQEISFEDFLKFRPDKEFRSSSSS